MTPNTDIAQEPLVLPITALILSTVLPMAASAYQLMASVIPFDTMTIRTAFHMIFMVSPMAGLVLAVIALSQGKGQSRRGVIISASSLILALHLCWRTGFLRALIFE